MRLIVVGYSGLTPAVMRIQSSRLEDSGPAIGQY